MEIKVNFLDKLRLEAKFDDFTVIADQPIRYKGDGSAPGPFDYFLASSALCAAYFVKLYCDTRKISTENIRLSQNNIVDPDNRYQQIFKIQVALPADIPELDRRGILNAIERCSVKKVVQAGPEFVIEEVENLDADAQSLLTLKPSADSSTFILGKDLPLEQTIANMSGLLAGLGIKIEIASWRNIIPNVWSLHIRDAHSPMCFTNGKGSTKESALASALLLPMARSCACASCRVRPLIRACDCARQLATSSVWCPAMLTCSCGSAAIRNFSSSNGGSTSVLAVVSNPSPTSSAGSPSAGSSSSPAQPAAGGGLVHKPLLNVAPQSQIMKRGYGYASCEIYATNGDGGPVVAAFMQTSDTSRFSEEKLSETGTARRAAGDWATEFLGLLTR
jgi:uncharacterized OsmC-like protein